MSEAKMLLLRDAESPLFAVGKTEKYQRDDSLGTGESKLKVAILCGGAGTRLREETEVRPKPMVEIGGQPILWHIMKSYNRWLERMSRNMWRRPTCSLGR